MKKVAVLALTAFSLVGYQAFAQEEREASEPKITSEVASESSETTLSFNGFKILFNENEEEELNSLAMNEESEDEASLV